MLQSNAWVNGFYTYLRLLMHRFVFVFKIGIHQVTKVGPVSWKKIFRAVDVELIWMNSCMCSRGALSEHSMSHPLSQITRAGWVIDMERVDQWSNVSRPVNHQPTRTEIMYTGYYKKSYTIAICKRVVISERIGRSRPGVNGYEGWKSGVSTTRRQFCVASIMALHNRFRWLSNDSTRIDWHALWVSCPVIKNPTQRCRNGQVEPTLKFKSATIFFFLVQINVNGTGTVFLAYFYLQGFA